ncbi:hypothetical protein [Ammoniphilus resinae]|uniref:Uncharacterized protein n=1 Tax=Ammoniphilus resinae TaxID=861532 RepID=A0ABS4GXL6_9BACL|nr:hypothetical protein [Ammoniphilus resinae]MBP1935011.1 hypothetical protein [Ammoniphilus resinae]
MITIATDIINTKENRQLLYKYLSKFFNPEKAQSLIKEHNQKGTLWTHGGLAYSLGKRSIEFFSMYFLQDTFVPKPDNQARNLSPTHYEVWELLEQCLIKDEFDKVVLCLPRGFAKSTIVTYATVIHQGVYNTPIGFYQMVIGKTEADAQQFIFDVRYEC